MTKQCTREAPFVRAAAETVPVIVLPPERIYPGDLMDRALDKLRTIELALTPENETWRSESVLLAVWATLGEAIRELEPVRDHLQCGEGDEVSQ